MALNVQTLGTQLPTTYVWDVSQIQNLNISSDFKELLIRLYQNLNTMANVINTKESSYYLTTGHFYNGQNWFPNSNMGLAANYRTIEPRSGIRAVTIDIPLPNTATVSVPHNITCTTQTRIFVKYAMAYDNTGTSWLPLPYASSVAANVIELNIDNTNINITTNTNRTAYTAIVVLDYIQN